VNAALRQAVAAAVSAADWRARGPAYLASLRLDGAGVLRGWKQVAASSERHLAGRVYHADVSVEVDVAALRERLSSVNPAAPAP